MAVVLATGLAACSLNASARSLRAASSEPTAGPSASRSGTPVKAHRGDAELKNDYFKLYTGKHWIGFQAPDRFKLNKASKDGVDYQTLTSPSDSKTNIVFARSKVGSLPTSEELVASLPKANGAATARPEISDIAGFKAVAAAGAPDSGGYTGMVMFVDFDGDIWGITVNAPDDATRQKLTDAVRQIKADQAGAPSTSATPKPSVKPESIKAAVNGGAYSVTVEGATLSIAIPSGFTEQRFDTAGLVGVGDSADNGRNINFWIDQSGLTAKESELLKLTREQTSANEVEEVRSVPSVPSVAGHKTAACDIRRKDGKVSRLYVVDVNGVVVQIAVNEPNGAGGRFAEMVKTVESAT